MEAQLPHEGVYVRLGISRIHGIGVHAIVPIPAGTNIFSNDRVELVWVERDKLDGLPPAQRQLYYDFGIARGSLMGCPVNFHNLTPGWYCNEPAPGESANVRVDASLNFLAARDIAVGEEVTFAMPTSATRKIERYRSWQGWSANRRNRVYPR